MTTYTFKLENDHGLHARPAGYLTKVCSGYESKITLIKNGQCYNAKSMLGILKMAGAKGDELLLEVEGADEVAALEAIKTLIASNFNE